MTEQELIENIAKDLMINYAHRSAGEQAKSTLAIIKEAGYFLEEADLVGKYIDRGWIPPEEVKMGR